MDICIGPKFLYYLFAVILTYQILEIHERDGISFQSQKITKKIRADIMPSQKVRFPPSYLSQRRHFTVSLVVCLHK